MPLVWMRSSSHVSGSRGKSLFSTNFIISRSRSRSRIRIRISLGESIIVPSYRQEWHHHPSPSCFCRRCFCHRSIDSARSRPNCRIIRTQQQHQPNHQPNHELKRFYFYGWSSIRSASTKDGVDHSSYYYDSQSGRHVPIHDETKVSVFADVRRTKKSLLLLRDHHYFQKSLLRYGYSGALRSYSHNFVDDDDDGSGVVITATSDPPSNFIDFVQRASESDPSLLTSIENHRDVVWMLDLDEIVFYPDDRSSLASILTTTAKNSKRRIAVGICHARNFIDRPPFEVALDVARIVDEDSERRSDDHPDGGGGGGGGGGGLGEFLWISPRAASSNDDDDDDENSNNHHNNQEGEKKEEGNPIAVVEDDQIISLCEELVNVDVPGPTFKSRLVVDLQSHHRGREDDHDHDDHELANECLLMGINKFVVHEDNLDRFQTLVENHGKSMKGR